MHSLRNVTDATCSIPPSQLGKVSATNFLMPILPRRLQGSDRGSPRDRSSSTPKRAGAENEPAHATASGAASSEGQSPASSFEGPRDVSSEISTALPEEAAAAAAEAAAAPDPASLVSASKIVGHQVVMRDTKSILERNRCRRLSSPRSRRSAWAWRDGSLGGVSVLRLAPAPPSVATREDGSRGEPPPAAGGGSAAKGTRPRRSRATSTPSSRHATAAP